MSSATIHTPLLAPWLRRGASDDRLLFGHGDELVTLYGGAARVLLPRLLPLLDGTRDAEAIVAELGEPARPAVLNALELLERQGLIVDGPAVPDGHPARGAGELLASQTRAIGPAAVADAVAAARVVVLGAGSVAAAVAETLAASGLPARPGSLTAALERDLDASDLVVVVPAAVEITRLDDWNRRALRDDIPWMLVLPFDGVSALVGPIVLPAETACFACLGIRRAASLPSAEELRDLEPAAAPPGAAFLDRLVGGLASLAVLRWVGVGDPLFVGAAYTLDVAREVALTRHVVYPVPRCPECSPLAASGPVTPWFG